MCTRTTLKRLQHNGKNKTRQTKCKPRKWEGRMYLRAQRFKNSSTCRKLSWNRRKTEGHKHGVVQWRQLTGLFRIKDGVVQDNPHQPDFKAAWHLTGRGHYFHPNISWSKANKKKKKEQKAPEKNICSVVTAENKQDRTCWGFSVFRCDVAD